MPEGEWTQQHFRDQLISDTGIVDFRGDAAKRGDASWWNLFCARSEDETGGSIPLVR
jgi:hypothetical protein